jgi:hypothetical protein
VTPTTCKHYACKPGMEFVCARGVDIRKHVGGPSLGWMARMPCVTTKLSKEQISCDHREYPTAEEVEQSEREMRQAIDRFVAGRSPCCDVGMVTRGTARFCSKCTEFVGRACSREDVRG